MIKTYKKRSPVYQGIQLTKTNIREVYSWLFGAPDIQGDADMKRWGDYVDGVIKEGIPINTPYGVLKLRVGDYVLKKPFGPHGYMFLPVSKSYFEGNYSEVVEGVEVVPVRIEKPN